MPLTDARASARGARLALERLLGELDVPPSLPAGFLDRVEAYVDLLLDANAGVNLTRVVEPDAVARLHLLDSIAALPHVDQLAPGRAVDLGSGGGVPGLVLALARPSIEWTLVDSVAKKADALRSFSASLHPSSLRVLGERAEVLGRDPAHRESYDLVTARACAALPVLAEYALPLLRIGGRLIAWKGPISDDELAAGAAAADLLGGGPPLVHPSGLRALGGHRFVVVDKRSATSERFPRRRGQPLKSPLGRSTGHTSPGH
ncbi:MAG TPA: 16S rRNA (guanine(527)-N(7))-methyltransferase RsmG [Candidatus Limnocylindria bacterium]|nr:16S rRNA (guanine(527)-N(7))-methyltransferase RsmG [Candidatus Limnocylindria bacterium]